MIRSGRGLVDHWWNGEPWKDFEQKSNMIRLFLQNHHSSYYVENRLYIVTSADNRFGWGIIIAITLARDQSGSSGCAEKQSDSASIHILKYLKYLIWDMRRRKAFDLSNWKYVIAITCDAEACGQNRLGKEGDRVWWCTSSLRYLFDS